jgi:hypothetical protein
MPVSMQQQIAGAYNSPAGPFSTAEGGFSFARKRKPAPRSHASFFPFFFNDSCAGQRPVALFPAAKQNGRDTGPGDMWDGGESYCAPGDSEGVRSGPHCAPGISASDCVRSEPHRTPVGAGDSESGRLGPHCAPDISVSDRVRSEPHRTPVNGEGVRSSLPSCLSSCQEDPCLT